MVLLSNEGLRKRLNDGSEVAKSRQSPKPPERKGSNDARRNGKAPKKNPRSSEQLRTGRTVGGFSASKQKERELKRQNRLLEGYELNK
jgi:hypothetical protein